MGQLAVPSHAAPVVAPDRAVGSARVLVLSDIKLYRDVLTASLAAQPGVGACEALATVDEAIPRLAGGDGATIVLMDMARPESYQAVRALLAAAPAVPILAFAVGDSDEEVLACAEAGVAGFVLRSGSLQELAEAIHRLARGELLCSPRTAASLFRRLSHLAAARRDAAASQDPLTSREREISVLLDDGLSNKEIARRLHIEVATVKNHVHRILEKLHVSRRGEAAARLRMTRPPRRIHS